MANDRKISLQIDDSQANSVLTALEAKVRSVEDALNKLGSKLGASAMQDPGYRGLLEDYATSSGMASATKAVLGSSRISGNPASVDQVMAAATSGAKAGGDAFGFVMKNNSQLPADTVLNSIRNMTANVVPPMASVNAQAAMQQILQSAGAMQPAPTGPYSSITPMAQNQRMYQHWMMQNDQRRMAMMSGAGSFGYGAMDGVQSGFQLSTQYTLQGGYNPMGERGAYGAMAGAALAGASAFIPVVGPFIAPIAATVLPALGKSFGEWTGAKDEIEQRSRVLNLRGTGVYGPYGEGGPRFQAANAMNHQAELLRQINTGTALGSTRPLKAVGLDATAEQFAQVNASFGSSLFSGGLDPFAKTGNIVGPDAEYRRLAGRMRQGGSIERMITGTEMSVMASGFHNESTREMYSRRLFNIFGKGAVDMGNLVAPIFASTPEHGGNYADIMAQFGPEASSLFSRLQSDDGIGEAEPSTFRRSSLLTRSARRAGRFGSLQTRGSAAAVASSAQDEMDAISMLPGGTDSLTYAEARARRRDANAAAFDTESITTFNIPSMKLEAASQIMRSGPYMPGNSLVISAARIRQNNQQIGRINQYVAGRRASGDLSEAEEQERMQQVLGLQVSNAQSIASMAEGGDNLVAAMSYGRPGRFRRMDGAALASMHLGRMGSPRRSEGAVNGAQMAGQDAFFEGLGLSAGGPSSRTMAMNNGGGTSRLEALLEELIRVVSGSGMAGGRRPGEALGALSAYLDGKRIQDPSAGNFN